MRNPNVRAVLDIFFSSGLKFKQMIDGKVELKASTQPVHPKTKSLLTLFLRRTEKPSALSAVLVLLVTCPLFVKSFGKTYHISREKRLTKVVTPFAYVSEIGSMVGGLNATSNSQYINDAGLVQVSKEETNGVLHMLRIGQTDTSVFFNNLAKNYNSLLPKRKSAEKDQPLELSEYYPPQTMICFLVPAQNNIICNYYKKNETTDALIDFVNEVGKIITKSELSLAQAGLYVRAQSIPAAYPNFIEPDIKLQYSNFTSNKKLLSIIKNEMALIRVSGETASIALTDKITLQPDKSIYIQIDKRVYLLITYRYKG